MNLTDKKILKSELQADPRRLSISNSHGHQFYTDHNHVSEGLQNSPSGSLTRVSEASFPAQNAIMSKKSFELDLEKNFSFSNRTHASIRSSSEDSIIINLGVKDQKRDESLPVIGLGKSLPPPLENPDQYIVEFDGPEDPTHPLNWSAQKKYYTVIILGFSTAISVFASSIFSTSIIEVSKQYHVANEVGIMGLSLYVLGFSLGPLIWAPLSELKGRRPTLVWPMFGLAVFQAGVAAGKDIQTILICRFWSGSFGAAPLAIVGAVFSDIFDLRIRAVAVSIFSMTVFAGPFLAPFVGGFIIENNLGWRWTQWLVVILSFISFLINLFLVNETYPPAILVSKAVNLRQKSKNWAIHAKQEEIDMNFRQLIIQNLSRPLRLLFTEPIILLVAIYMSFVYGILYLFLTSYPIVFQKIHAMSPGIGGLPYFGMICGMIIGGFYVILIQPSYNRKLDANNNIPVPEWRIPPMIIGGVAFTIGLFWFSWSGYDSSIHWIVPTLSGVPTGFGILLIFLQSMNYLLDVYVTFSASAIASVSTLRSLAGASFPLFSQALFRKLGINWGGTFLGCIALALIPIPIIFFYYGARIRKNGFSSS